MKIAHKNLLLLLLLLVFSFQNFLTEIPSNAALTTIVRGTIKDEVTLKPIDGAIISTSGIGATISVNGEFLFGEIPGTWTLVARAEGYETYKQEITVGETDEFVRIDILMVPRDDAITSICPSELLYREHSAESQLLRSIRDNVLSKSPEGKELIKLYYQWSPVIVKAMEADEECKQEVKDIVDEILPIIGGEQ